MNAPPPPPDGDALPPIVTNRDLYHMLMDLKGQVDRMAGALKLAAFLTPICVSLIVYFTTR